MQISPLVALLRNAVRKAFLGSYFAVLLPFLSVRRAYVSRRAGRTWMTSLTGSLWVGGFLWHRDVSSLRDLGVTAVVNVSHELYDPCPSLAAEGIDYRRVPCWDTRAPALDEVIEAVDFIADKINSGGKVYIHCANGLGRSITVAICYLVAHEHMRLDHAIALVRSLRTIKLSVRQSRFLESFEQSLRQEAAGAAIAFEGVPGR